MGSRSKGKTADSNREWIHVRLKRNRQMGAYCCYSEAGCEDNGKHGSQDSQRRAPVSFMLFFLQLRELLARGSAYCLELESLSCGQCGEGGQMVAAGHPPLELRGSFWQSSCGERQSTSRMRGGHQARSCKTSPSAPIPWTQPCVSLRSCAVTKP